MEAKKRLAAELVPAADRRRRAARPSSAIASAPSGQRAADRTLEPGTGDIWICQLLKQIGFAASTSEARRLASQGAVRVDGNPVDAEFKFRPGRDRLIAVGRRRLAEVRYDPSDA
jgi:tyrosyl-tRNA synthetase